MIRYRTTRIDDLDIFYREAGDPKKPANASLTSSTAAAPRDS